MRCVPIATPLHLPSAGFVGIVLLLSALVLYQLAVGGSLVMIGGEPQLQEGRREHCGQIMFRHSLLPATLRSCCLALACVCSSFVTPALMLVTRSYEL
jgi:hypothetical protein